MKEKKHQMVILETPKQILETPNGHFIICIQSCHYIKDEDETQELKHKEDIWLQQVPIDFSLETHTIYL